MGGRLYFAADDGVHGRELWSTDGTAQGTVLVQDLEPGPVGSTPTAFAEADGWLFFSATTAGRAARPGTPMAAPGHVDPMPRHRARGLNANPRGFVRAA
ncbi:ELWxxDGT repeat protein, partial [Corallococcus sp. 4LFB]|uniref:ELWxxDGT repeat protein n=1 Tax=Corallococcus sp. 4LFB TaxID=3383249 RepID=UPI0039756C07